MIREKLYNMSQRLVDLFFPPACPICGTVVDGEIKPCKDCKVKISYVSEPVCMKCGKEIADEDVELCKDCSVSKKSYIKGFPCIKYIEPMTESMAQFKYHNKRSYAKYYAQEIIKCHGRELAYINPEVLVPVPVHKSKLKSRGYNQADLIAKELSGYLKIPVDSELVTRITKTSPQKELNAKGRGENLKKAFNSTDKIVQYKCALLVDDIYTTGATIEACTRVLHDKGIKHVYYTSVCIGVGE